jgi:hypothetical protein
MARSRRHPGRIMSRTRRSLLRWFRVSHRRRARQAMRRSPRLGVDAYGGVIAVRVVDRYTRAVQRACRVRGVQTPLSSLAIAIASARHEWEASWFRNAVYVPRGVGWKIGSIADRLLPRTPSRRAREGGRRACKGGVSTNDRPSRNRSYRSQAHRAPKLETRSDPSRGSYWVTAPAVLRDL